MTRFIPAAVLAVLVVVLVAVPAGADPCRRASCGYAASYTPTYYPPTYYPPTYYDYGHYYDTVIVPKALKVYASPDFYYGVGDEYRQAAFARLVADELSRIADAKARLERPSPAVLPPAPPTGVGPAPPVPPPEPQRAAAPAPQGSKVATVLYARCAGCHNGKQSPDLSGDPDAVPEVVRLRSFLAVSLGKMPKGKPPLPQEDYEALANWAGQTGKK